MVGNQCVSGLGLRESSDLFCKDFLSQVDRKIENTLPISRPVIFKIGLFNQMKRGAAFDRNPLV